MSCPKLYSHVVNSELGGEGVFNFNHHESPWPLVVSFPTFWIAMQASVIAAHWLGSCGAQA